MKVVLKCWVHKHKNLQISEFQNHFQKHSSCQSQFKIKISLWGTLYNGLMLFIQLTLHSYLRHPVFWSGKSAGQPWCNALELWSEGGHHQNSWCWRLVAKRSAMKIDWVEKLHPPHTVILPDWTSEKWGLYSFIFQSL